MSSPWKKKQPEVVADAILKRAEIAKIGRNLKTRLAYAHYKTVRGWEDLPLATIEPKVAEELERKKKNQDLVRKNTLGSGDGLSDSSSSTASDGRHYLTPRHAMSSPLKPAIFSDQVGPRSSGMGYRKRSHHNSFEYPGSSSSSRKRICSSPTAGRSLNSGRAWDGHQLTQSSPIKPRRQPYFTTSDGPAVSFYQGTSQSDDLQSTNFAAASDDEENSLPVHSFNIRSSPPRTPPPIRNRGSNTRRNKDKNGKLGEEGADLLLYLATSPSPANPTSRVRMQPPSTPPPKNLALPSSMMTTPGGGPLLPMFPNTPSQNFDFAEFVNITPSPAQNSWPKTPRTIKTPGTVNRRRLTFDQFLTTSSPLIRDHSTGASKANGLGMELGGNLLS